MSADAAATETGAWQLRMFDKSLKKKQKLQLLLDLLGPLSDQKCLLVTDGDNNGALNFHFRKNGGRWSWVEMEERSIPAMEGLLGEKVHHGRPDDLPFPDGSFDRVVVIDVHEHQEDVGPLNREVARIVAPGGVAIVTTPNGDERLPVALLKRIFGMGPAAYGHVVQGYTSAELASMMEDVGLRPETRGAYSRFFTELAEFAINFAYVKLLSRKKSGPKVDQGTIAPSSEEQLRAVEKTYRMYSRIYPLVRAFSALDALVPGRGGYAVAVGARKPGG